MAAIEDIIGWCKAERSRLAQRLDQLQSGRLRIVEKQQQQPGWLEIDTTAQSIDLCRQNISELNAIIARHPEVAAAARPPLPIPRIVPPTAPPPAADAEHRALPPDVTHPGWVNGWGVVKGQQPNWRFLGIYQTHAEADEAAAKAGDGHYVRWGGYSEHTKEFISGPHQFR